MYLSLIHICFSREVLRLPPAAALGPGGSLDEFWTRAAQHCGVAEVEIDGKLVYPCLLYTSRCV